MCGARGGERGVWHRAQEEVAPSQAWVELSLSVEFPLVDQGAWESDCPSPLVLLTDAKQAATIR